MKNKNYYPLRPGNASDQIVSDVSPNRYHTDDEEQRELQHYGGHLIAESVLPSVRDQLILAYNEKYGLEMKDFQVKFDAKAMIAMVNATNNAFNQLLPTPELMMVRAEFHKLTDYIFNTFHSLYYHPEGNSEPDLPKIKIPNPRQTPPVESQIKAAVGMPDSITVTEYVDSVKVIEDLLHFSHYAVQNLDKANIEEYGFVKMHDSLFNAEAALGHLQAMKEQRGHIGTSLLNKVGGGIDVPMQNGRLERISEVEYEHTDYKDLRLKLQNGLENVFNRQQSVEILWVIERMLELNKPK